MCGTLNLNLLMLFRLASFRGMPGKFEMVLPVGADKRRQAGKKDEASFDPFPDLQRGQTFAYGDGRSCTARPVSIAGPNHRRRSPPHVPAWCPKRRRCAPGALPIRANMHSGGGGAQTERHYPHPQPSKPARFMFALALE